MIRTFSLRRRASALLGAVLVSGALTTGIARAAEPDTPAQFVTGFLGDASKVFTKGAGSEQLRYEELRALFKVKMDIPLIAAFVVGPSLKEEPPVIQEHFRDLLTSHLVQVFYDTIKDFVGSSFDAQVMPPSPDGTITVKTIVREPGYPSETILWRIEKFGDEGFKIVEVVSKGISMMVLERASFIPTLRQGGLSKLIAMLEERDRAARNPR